MSSTNTKQLAERIHMFFNLLYHIDDYIKNKKERKGQLRLPKSIRLILREVISSKINLNYFINKEELDSYKVGKKSEDDIQKEKEYIRIINPLSFNQKNLETINLFYNTNNEMFIINYLSIDKIFTIIQFCFRQLMKQKKIDFKKKYEDEHKNFVLFNIEESDLLRSNSNKYMDNNLSTKNNIIKKILKIQNKDSCINYPYYTDERRLFEIDKNKSNNNIGTNNSVNIFSIMNNSYKLNNVTSILNYNKNNLITKNNNLKMQINKINKQMNLSPIKSNNKISLSKNKLKRNISLPLINVNKNHNRNNSCRGNESIKINDYTSLLNNSKKNIPEKNKNDYNIKKYNYNRILPLYNMAKINEDNFKNKNNY